MSTIKYYQNRKQYFEAIKAAEDEFTERLNNLNKEYLNLLGSIAEKYRISPVERRGKSLKDLISSNERIGP